jgi:hypothetical protein
MKKIKIGKKTYDLCQTKDDINFVRFTMVKQYAPQIWEKMDSPLFETYMDRVSDHFNKGNFMHGWMELENYRVALHNIENGNDAWGVCFALICLEPGEDQTRYDEAFLMEKLQRMIADGLTAGQVHDAVVDFWTRSPEVFSPHLTTLAILGEVNLQSMFTRSDSSTAITSKDLPPEETG